MALYQQNAPQEWPRNGTAPCKDNYPLSYTIMAPQENPPSMENPASTRSSFRRVPLQEVVRPSFGDHDGLNGALMAVAQADLYQSAVGPFPRAGTWEEPGGPIAASMMVRLAPTTSAHPGLTAATGAGPTMIFTAPPVFSVQTRPIYAIGL